MLLLPALLLAGNAPEAGKICPDLTTNAAELCADAAITMAWAEAEAAFVAWVATDPRTADIADRRAELQADLRRGFQYNAQGTPEQADAAQVIENLGYAIAQATQQAQIARSVQTPAGFGADLATICQVKAVTACRVEAAGFLAVGPEGAERRVAWQTLGGLESNGTLPIRMAVAWDVTGPSAQLIGFSSTEGEASPPHLVDNGEDIILHFPARTAGTGEGNADALFMYRGGAWVNIGMTTWKDELPARLPQGMGLWKGVDYGYHGLSSSFPVWRDDDANCCPTAGEAYASFTIANNRLAIETLDFTPGPAVQVKALSCPIVQATYRSSWPSRFTVRFEKPKFSPNAQSDLIAVLEQRDEDDAPIFTRHFAFAGSNGFGSASIIAVNGAGDADGPPDMLEGQADAETVYFHAFMGEPAGLKYIAEPPQSTSPAPFGLFLPDLARALWYDGVPDPKGGQPIRIDMPRDMWHGRCLTAEEL